MKIIKSNENETEDVCYILHAIYLNICINNIENNIFEMSKILSWICKGQWRDKNERENEI